MLVSRVVNVAACDDRTPHKNSGSSTNYVCTVLTDSHSIVLLGLFVMAIFVEYAMLDLNVQMAKAKHHVLVKHTH